MPSSPSPASGGGIGAGAPVMLIGHYAVAFAAKRVVPGVSLNTLFLAAQLIDALWLVFDRHRAYRTNPAIA